ncbi:hypothetical protein KR018_007669 [Drosophila ironensis]|nr:hypothetical protein KR018_007669 [Drosophila ironensis]
MKFNPLWGLLFLALLQGECLGQGDQELVALEKGLQSLTDITALLRSEFDRSLRFGELQEALEKIDKKMLGYGGDASKNLDEMRHLASASVLSYGQSWGNVFEWCTAMNTTLTTSLPVLEGSQSADEQGRQLFWNQIIQALRQGLTGAQETVRLFGDAKSQRSQLYHLLDAMERDVRKDFSPAGYYANGYKDPMAKSAAGRHLRSILAAPATFLMLFYEALAYKLHDKREIQEVPVSKDPYFVSLEELIEKAKELAPINVGFAEEMEGLTQLEELFARQQVLKLQAPLLSRLQKLGDKCYDFTTWRKAHKGG